MDAAYVFPLSVFGAGLILLIGWLCLTFQNHRATILLVKSLAVFALPMIAFAFLPPRALSFPFGRWLWILVEELLKAAAALTEERPTDRFFIVSLFGIWELMLSKPLWGLTHAGILSDWHGYELAGLTLAATVTVLMHCVTAEIYASPLGRRMPLAIAAGWVVHSLFNGSVEVLGVSLLASLLQFAALFLVFVAVWPKTSVAPRR